MRRRKLSCWSTAPTPGTRENLAVEQQSWWWPGRGSAPGSAARMRQLTEARAAEPWLAQGSSSVQQQALRDFSHAMAAFFDPPNPAGKPSYRSKRGTQGFVIRDVTARRLNRNHAEVFVPKCGYVRFRLSRDLPADPGMARVTCDRSGRWHVAFGGPQPAVGRQPTGAVTGIDRGVRTGSCWGLLATRSAQKAAASGAVVLYVDPRHSSQQCRRCGHIASSSRESQAVFRCVACGHEDHADANAAKNVLARGLACLAVPAQAPGLRGVRPRKTPVNPGAAGTTREAA